MRISPLYEALIYIEDKGSVSLQDLNFLGEAVLRGILGKMEAMKLVKKDDRSNFRISLNGQNLLNRYLDNLHKSTLHFDGKWRLVCFSIPENMRSRRDKFRRFLEKTGFRMILTGLWISPLNLSEEVTRYSKANNIFQNVFICETNQIFTGISQEKLLTLWNFERSKAEIYQFIKDADEFLKGSDKSSYAIKKMIFCYALILENQPRLPIELFPKDWPQFRANLAYNKVKRLLVK